MNEDNDVFSESANAIIRELKRTFVLAQENALNATEARLKAEKERDDANENLRVVREANIRLADEVKDLKWRLYQVRLSAEGKI